jgi:predicted nucleic acid-binding protein
MIGAAVGNTGPLIALAKADQLTVLEAMYGVVQIPPAVHRELLAKTGPEAQCLEDAFGSFVRVVPLPPLPAKVDHLTQRLGPGEQQAIALAFSNSGLLLIDDQAGRKAARQLGIEVSGVVGVLLEAKRNGHIRIVKPILETVRHRGYWLSDALVETALQIADELSHHD